MANELWIVIDGISIKGDCVRECTYSRDRKAKKSLTSWESCDRPDSSQICNLSEYTADLKTNWDNEIQRVKPNINQIWINEIFHCIYDIILLNFYKMNRKRSSTNLHARS
jgi:hypothetical protein